MTDREETIKDKVVKTVRWFRNPNFRRASRLAAVVIESIPHLKSKNPWVVGMSLASLFDATLDSFDVEDVTKAQYLIKNKDLITQNGHLPKILVQSGLDLDLNAEKILTENGWRMHELSFKGEQLYFADVDSGASQDRIDGVSNYYYHTKDFDFEALMGVLWSKYEEGITLSLNSATADKGGMASSGIRLYPLSTKGYSYVGDIDPKKLADTANTFRRSKESISFMLPGPPGGGKSSFVYEVSRHISNRIIKIDPSVAYHLTGSALDFLLEHLRPDIILFDDFDRAAQAVQSGNMLFLMENIKTRFPETVIFATVNDFYSLDKALVRPGRFDKIIWFDLPSDNERKMVAKKYLEEYDISYEESLLSKIIDGTKGYTPVYIKELCRRIKYEGEECLESVLDEFSKTSELYEPPDSLIPPPPGLDSEMSMADYLTPPEGELVES